MLAEQPGVGTTAVLLRKEGDIDQLVAFYVPSGATPPEVKALRAGLAEKLPPYMVPARFEALPAMPRLQSGKIDRKVLKSQPLSAAAPAEGSDTPETPAEEVLFAALEKLFPGQPIRRERDFFSDLGGHSLFAARITSTLRQDPRFAQATVADIYQNRKLGLIAEALQAGMVGAEATADRPFVLHSAWRRWRCGIAQGLAIPFLVLLTMAQWLAPFFAYHFNTGDADDKISQAVFASVLTFIVAIVLNFAIALFARRVIAGNLKPGSYPLWGPDLLPLVAGRPHQRGGAGLHDQRFAAVRGLAAPARRQGRARGQPGLGHHPRAAPGAHWRRRQHRQRRQPGERAG